ncbi:hypothetical protein [Constantimarinum furrinae]|uniref:Membrane protein n=1 Tax=Constantimarinum furrinae TaxID=2562285 RepID=A0A7G8PWB7_9FLAO|nr:hypothetical protein [Constantimarinum furrinae]QNJ98633.1 membrane protein [Constantimarinum furrinae]
MEAPTGKTKAVVAYLTFVGMLIAYFMNRDNKHEFATWHIKNMFGLVILLAFAVGMQNYAVGIYIYFTTVALWLFSLVMAISNRKQAIPFLSEKFQEWFTFLD